MNKDDHDRRSPPVFESPYCKPLPLLLASDAYEDQPFARGAYTGFFPPGVMSLPEYWKAFQEMEKLPNVFLAGSDYHQGFGNGYIEAQSPPKATEVSVVFHIRYP